MPSSAYVQSHHDVLFETHTFAAGPVESFPPHVHEDYQIYLSMSTPATYWYRGAWHTIPPHALCVLHSGEAHAARSLGDREQQQAFQLLYVAPHHMQAIATTLANSRTSEPFFAKPLIADSSTIHHFTTLTHQLSHAVTDLESESTILLSLEQLIDRFSDVRTATTPYFPEHAHNIRDFLHDHWDRNISLTELSTTFEISASYICRIFKRTFQLSPHAYHLQIRIHNAKQLLIQGHSPSAVAVQTGFYDQSHFITHFKRLVGVTPARYIFNH